MRSPSQHPAARGGLVGWAIRFVLAFVFAVATVRSPSLAFARGAVTISGVAAHATRVEVAARALDRAPVPVVRPGRGPESGPPRVRLDGLHAAVIEAGGASLAAPGWSERRLEGPFRPRPREPRPPTRAELMVFLN